MQPPPIPVHNLAKDKEGVFVFALFKFLHIQMLTSGQDLLYKKKIMQPCKQKNQQMPITGFCVSRSCHGVFYKQPSIILSSLFFFFHEWARFISLWIILWHMAAPDNVSDQCKWVEQLWLCWAGICVFIGNPWGPECSQIAEQLLPVPWGFADLGVWECWTYGEYIVYDQVLWCGNFRE